MKNPLTQWKNWIIWSILSLAAAGLNYILSKNPLTLFSFFTWLIFFGFINMLMYKAGWK